LAFSENAHLDSLRLQDHDLLLWRQLAEGRKQRIKGHLWVTISKATSSMSFANRTQTKEASIAGSKLRKDIFIGCGKVLDSFPPRARVLIEVRLCDVDADTSVLVGVGLGITRVVDSELHCRWECRVHVSAQPFINATS